MLKDAGPDLLLVFMNELKPSIHSQMEMDVLKFNPELRAFVQAAHPAG